MPCLQRLLKVRVSAMLSCEICGKATVLYRTVVEGTDLNACESCARFGRILGKVEIPSSGKEKTKQPENMPEIIEQIAADFSEKIKMKRQELGLKQGEFAKLVAEKESVVHKMEAGEFEPTLETARKFEKLLKIKLVETYEEQGLATKKSGSSGFTLGDVAKVRKR